MHEGRRRRAPAPDLVAGREALEREVDDLPVIPLERGAVEQFVGPSRAVGEMRRHRRESIAVVHHRLARIARRRRQRRAEPGRRGLLFLCARDRRRSGDAGGKREAVSSIAHVHSFQPFTVTASRGGQPSGRPARPGLKARPYVHGISSSVRVISVRSVCNR